MYRLDKNQITNMSEALSLSNEQQSFYQRFKTRMESAEKLPKSFKETTQKQPYEVFSMNVTG